MVVNVRHYAKFWAIGQAVLEIWRFLDIFKMATSAILDFL